MKLKFKQWEENKMMKRIINGIKLMLVAVLMCLAVVSAEAIVDNNFKIAVNDYPDHQDSSLTKNIPNAYVNIYEVELEEGTFKVDSHTTINTGESGIKSIAIESGKLVYFEGFKTLTAAQIGAENKKAVSWTAPPYKNFGVAGKLCQTNYANINQMFKNDEEYACASSLSTPYIENQIVVPIVTETIDLEVASLNFDETSLRAKVCNLGNKAINGFKLKFVANGKENVLTYVPELTATKCVSIYSWGYSYFGLEASKMTLAEVYVDPLNEYGENNENNNYKKTEKRPDLVKETEKESSMLPAYDETKVDENEKTKEMLPAYDETRITVVSKPKLENCENSCEYLGRCLPIGTKIKDREGAKFCNWDNKMLPQLAEAENCQNDYECLSNSCSNNKCLDLEKKLQEQQNMLEKILAWLGRIFG